MDRLDIFFTAYLDREVGLGVEQLGAEGQQQLLVGVDDVRRLDESLHSHRLRQGKQTKRTKQNKTQPTQHTQAPTVSTTVVKTGIITGGE